MRFCCAPARHLSPQSPQGRIPTHPHVIQVGQRATKKLLLSLPINTEQCHSAKRLFLCQLPLASATKLNLFISLCFCEISQP